MKSFIEKVFKAKKEKQESVTDIATEAAIESIEPKEKKHDINSCGCYKCELARDQGAK